MALLIATTNAGKLREIIPILSGLPFELATLASWPGIPAPDETGRTFGENARAKAAYYAAATGLATVAEDSGLEIDRLDGAPGVESARFAGADTPYIEKFARIAQLLRAKGHSDSPARFVCAVALVSRSGDVVFETAGTIEGTIRPKPRGTGGFGYDPIFYYAPFGCTLAEAGERKSPVSHRGKAFKELRRWLESHPAILQS